MNLIGINPVPHDRRNGSALCCTTHGLEYLRRSGYSPGTEGSITCRGAMNPIAMLPPPLRSAAEIAVSLVMAIVIADRAQAFVVKPYVVPSVSIRQTFPQAVRYPF